MRVILASPQSRFLEPTSAFALPRFGHLPVCSWSCVISPKSVELFAPGHHVWVGENVTARTPIFCVVLKDGEYWEVEAEWPDGTIEPVYKFKAGLEALNWVKTQSAAWVAERVAMASQ